MRLVFLVLGAVVVTGGASAQTPYKCTLDGKTIYQDQPCSGDAAQSGSVNTHNAKPPTNRDATAAEVRRLKDQVKVLEGEVQQHQQRRPAPKSAAAAPQKRTAIEYDDYLRIRRGMTTQEVFAIAGRPASKDFAAQNPYCRLNEVYETWLYPGDSTESHTTEVQFCDQRVMSVKRSG